MEPFFPGGTNPTLSSNFAAGTSARRSPALFLERCGNFLLRLFTEKIPDVESILQISCIVGLRTPPPPQGASTCGNEFEMGQGTSVMRTLEAFQLASQRSFTP